MKRHCNGSGIFCLSPGSPFAGKARLFIWRSVNIKYTTCAALQLTAPACSRRGTGQELWEQRASMSEITMPRACSALPCPAWASTPFLPCAFLCLFKNRCVWVGSTASHELDPAGANASQPPSHLSKAFLPLTAWASHGCRSAASSSSPCIPNLLPNILVTPQSPSSSSFVLPFNHLCSKFQGGS